MSSAEQLTLTLLSSRSGEHSPEQQRLILRNAAMLLSDLGLENDHEIG